VEKKPIVLPPNTVVGAWKPTTPLGQGGQGAVWAAKPVKVKHTPPRALKACFAPDEQGRSRFIREVETLRRCDCPYILKVYDHDLEWKQWVAELPPFAYYVAEKCQGSIAQQQARLGDMRRRLILFRQICAALTYLHSMPDPVIHRDIKPDNFLITQELANVVIADFGIARALSDSTLTQAFEIVGTPYYRAPEVLHGSRGTTESDIYGLGRLLEWLLTGEVSTDMATRALPRGLEIDDDACNALDRIIAKATQVTPAHRYSSVQALADQLPDLWLSMKPRPKTGPVLPDTNVAVVLPAALELARTSDQLGWRQLQNQLRRDLVDGLTAWRNENERNWPGDRNKEGGAQFTDAVLDLAIGRIVFGLAGVYSNNPAFTDQRLVAEDLLTVPNWSPGGTAAISDAPRTLVYVYQYLHGALCMSYGQPDLALQLAGLTISEPYKSETHPLWRDRGLVGWPQLLGGTCTWAWEYVRSLRERRPALEQFFALQSDFDVGLAAYSMLLVLHELADDAARATPEAIAKADFLLDVPPLFTAMSPETVGAAARRTFGSPPLVARVAERAGGNVDTMRRLWPSRKKLILKFNREVFNQWGYIDRAPMPEHLG
jgi:hypothetical protein